MGKKSWFAFHLFPRDQETCAQHLDYIHRVRIDLICDYIHRARIYLICDYIHRARIDLICDYIYRARIDLICDYIHRARIDLICDYIHRARKDLICDHISFLYETLFFLWSTFFDMVFDEGHVFFHSLSTTFYFLKPQNNLPMR